MMPSSLTPINFQDEGQPDSRQFSDLSFRKPHEIEILSCGKSWLKMEITELLSPSLFWSLFCALICKLRKIAILSEERKLP